MTVADLQQAARDHLWLHFTRMGGYRDAEVPIIVRGDGCYLEDVHGNRYLDALAGLFSVNLGYSFGEEIGQAALEQMRELPFYTNWSYSHPRAIELAEEVASLAPGDLNRVFFVSGGSEAVESAWKLARQYYLARGTSALSAAPPSPRCCTTNRAAHALLALQGDRPAHRVPRDDVRRALDQRHPRASAPVRAARARGAARVEHEPLPPPARGDRGGVHRVPARRARADDPRHGPGDGVPRAHGARAERRRRVRAPAGYWQGVRELCTEYDILLSADEVITGFGRVGHWFASERYDIRPDIVCCAKGLSSSYAAIGAVVATDGVMEPFLSDTSMFSHGITFGGHPVMCAIALKNIEIMKRERIVEGVLEHEAASARRSSSCSTCRSSATSAERASSTRSSWSRTRRRARRSPTTSASGCCAASCPPALFERGLICRADDRGDPVIQISPPLVARQAEFDRIVEVLGETLAEAWDELNKR